MATEGLTPEQAINAIRKMRPIVNPNTGFLIQLQLFYEMRCKLDPENESYRLYKMEVLGKQWWKEMTVETDTLAQVSDAPDLQVRFRCSARLKIQHCCRILTALSCASLRNMLMWNH